MRFLTIKLLYYQLPMLIFFDFITLLSGKTRICLIIVFNALNERLPVVQLCHPFLQV